MVHAGHRLAGPPTAATKLAGAAGSSGAWSASRSTSAATSPTPKPDGSRQPCCRRLDACRRSRSPRGSSRRSWPRRASRDDGRTGSANPAVVPGHRPATGVELVTHHHQQGLPSTGPIAVGWRRLQRHAQTQLTQVQQVQQVQFVQAAINGEYERAERETGEVFRERGHGDPCLSWCHAEPSRRTRSLLTGKGPDERTEMTARQTGAEVLSTGPPPRTRIHNLGHRPDSHLRPCRQRHGADAGFSVAVVHLVQGPSCGLQPAEEVRDLPFQR